MRLRVLFLLTFLAAGALAQNPGTSGAAADTGGPFINPNPLTTLASEFFEHDYVNFFAAAGGTVDFNQPVLNAAGQTVNSPDFGASVSAGVSLYHLFSNAELSMSYSGGYSWYENNDVADGTSQALNLSYARRLTKRISMSIGVSGGIVLYGSSVYVSEPTASGIVVSNPFSNETKFVGTSLGINISQTRRLSYGFYGGYFLSRYNYPGSIGSTGASAGVSVNYRLTARTTVSGVYGHSYFTYQRNAGNVNSDQVGVNIGHQFNNHWSASAYAGVGRSDAVGTVSVPVTLIIDNQAVGGYIVGQYNQKTTFPAYSLTVSHYIRRSVFSVSAGEGIAGAGNGYLLASKNIYVTGVFSYSARGQNISLGGAATRLSSIANTVGSSYNSASFSASYGRRLFRYVGAFLRYDYIQYGSLRPFAGVDDNRITFGFNFSSRSIPLTLF